jgi:hypothetical protein
MLIQPRVVCVSAEPDGRSEHHLSVQFGARHITACPFFSFSFSLLFLRLQSCFLLCPVSVEAVNCLSIHKDTRVLFQDILFCVMLPQFDFSHSYFGQHGCRVCHSLQFCTSSRRPQTWCSRFVRPIARVVQQILLQCIIFFFIFGSNKNSSDLVVPGR